MASEIQYRHTSGRNTYIQIRNSTGSIWNGTSFVAYATADVDNYDIAGTEQGTASGYYTATMPAAIAAGVYDVIAKERIGVSVAETDPDISVGELHWSGTVEIGLSTINARFPVRMAKNTAFSNFVFKMVQSGNHVTPLTGAVITSQRSIDGGAFAAASNSASEISNGWYKIDLSAADLNGDSIALKFTAASGDQRDITIVTQAA